MGVASQPANEAIALDTTAEIETPEHVRFDYPLAGPSRRAVAYLIDALIRLGVLLALLFLLSLVSVAAPDGFDGTSTGAFLVIYFALDWFYYVLFETLWSGRSPGKRVMRLRVVGQDGHSLTVLDSVLRNLLRAADFLPFGYAVGLVVMGRDPMFRRLGDMIAGTVVVVEEPARLTEKLLLHPPPTAAELDALPQRPPVSRQELEAIELFLRRRSSLAPLRESELADLVAPLFAKRMGLRYQNAGRFLGLIYARARGHAPVELHAQPQRRIRRGRGGRRGRPRASRPSAPAQSPLNQVHGPQGQPAHGHPAANPFHQQPGPQQPHQQQPQPYPPQQPQPQQQQPQPYPQHQPPPGGRW